LNSFNCRLYKNLLKNPMGKLVKILFLIILLVIVYVLIVVLKGRVGDLRPSLLPGGDIVQKLQQMPADKGEFTVSIFAQDLGKVRDLQLTPEGILLASNPSRGKIYALVDSNNDGKADTRKEVYASLDQPHGLAFYNKELYVAEETKVTKLKWDATVLETQPVSTVMSLPKGGRHTTRTITFNQNGDMFVSIGSTCDVCFESHPFLASVIKKPVDGETYVYASGLRNSVFIKFRPGTEQLWATEMGRDFLGDNLPPDEINILKEGDYGWPTCYGDRVYDSKFGANLPQYCDNTIPPVYKIQAHSAPLGLVFIDSPMFPEAWQADLFVAYHGSWNRSTPVGYKVVRLEIEGDKVIAEHDFLDIWLEGSTTSGRPVDLEFAPDGSLFISDDKAGVIYRVWR
jgi:glucose/arabinose dehydrogenase